jgi:hypothetical protein
MLNLRSLIRRSSRVDNTTMLARIEEVKQLVAKDQETREDILRLTKSSALEFQNVSQRLQVREVNSKKTLSIVQRTFSAVREVRELVDRVCPGGGGPADHQYALEESCTGEGY